MAGLQVIEQQQATRRMRLRVAVKVMLLVALAGVFHVLISIFFSQERDPRDFVTMRVDVGELQPGSALSVLWEQRPVLVYRRTAGEVVALLQGDTRLLDPASSNSTQPDWAMNSLRSRRDEWFVSIGVGTDMNCPIAHLAASAGDFQGLPWGGGFVDQCRGSRYDLAGRVFKGQYAERNLIVPPYLVDEHNIILGASQ